MSSKTTQNAQNTAAATAAANPAISPELIAALVAAMKAQSAQEAAAKDKGKQVAAQRSMEDKAAAALATATAGYARLRSQDRTATTPEKKEQIIDNYTAVLAMAEAKGVTVEMIKANGARIHTVAHKDITVAGWAW